MKKIYMPSDENLHKMQDLGANVYKYLVVKAVESLIVEGINYPHKGMLKGAYKYLSENPDIAHGIGLLYPEEIEYSPMAQYDAGLYQQLMDKSNDTSIYKLDNLSYFADAVIKSPNVIGSTIDKLDEQLPNRPEYRFSYKPSSLLDDIFSTKITSEIFLRSYSTVEALSRIEPAYALLFPTEISRNPYDECRLTDELRSQLLIEGINAYASRYQICSNISGRRTDREDYLTRPGENTKKLIKCIRQNPHNLY